MSMKILLGFVLFVLMSSTVLASLGTYEPGQTVTFAVICLTNEGHKDDGCTGAGSGILDPDDSAFKSPTNALAEVSDSVAPGLWRGDYLIPSGDTKDGTWSVFLNLTNSNSTSASGILSFQVVNESFDSIGSDTAAILVDTNELQTNQGSWLTATGFLSDADANNNFSDIASNFTKVHLDLDNPDQYKADVSSLSTHSASDVWSVATRALTGFGFTIGLNSTALVDIDTKLNASHSVGNWSSFGISASEVWAVGTREITGGTIDTVNDKSGYSLTLQDWLTDLNAYNNFTEIATNFTIVMLDLDDTGQYKATGFLTDSNAANNFSEIASNFTAVMLDLDNPSQYKATGFLTDGNAAANFSDIASNFTESHSDLDRILAVTEIRRAYVEDASASTTKFTTSLTEAPTDYWTRAAILFVSGSNEGQIRAVKKFVGATKEITLQTPLNTSPANGDNFTIVVARKFLTPDVAEMADAVWDENATDHIDVGTYGGNLNANISGLSLEIISVNDTLKSVNTTLAESVWTFSSRTVTSIAWTIFTAWDEFQNYIWNTTSRTITSFPFAVSINSTGVDLIWDELLTGSEHNIATSAGKRLREISGYAIHSGTAQAGNGYSITFAADAVSVDRIYNRNLIVIVSGAGEGQTRTIVDYDGTSKIAVIDRAWHVAPNSSSEYYVVADDTPLVVNHGIAQGGTSLSITLHSNSSSIDDTYRGSIVNIMASTGTGEARIISSYNGTSKVANITPAWMTSPDSTSIYVVMPYGQGIVCDFCSEALTELTDSVDLRMNDTHGTGDWSSTLNSEQNSTLYDIVDDVDMRMNTTHGTGAFGSALDSTQNITLYGIAKDVWSQIMGGGESANETVTQINETVTWIEQRG